MSEKFKTQKRNRLSSLVKVGFIGSISLATTSCAAVSENASQTSLQNCGGSAEFTQKAGNQIVTSVSQLQTEAMNEVAVLYKRVKTAGGSIKFSDSSGWQSGTDTLQTSPNNLLIAYPSAENGMNSQDYINFAFSNGKPETIAVGAVACTQNDGVYQTLLDTTLQGFIKDTAGLQ